MYRLYTILYNRQHENKKGPTDEEIEVAAGRRLMNPEAASAWLAELEKASNRLADAFNKQILKAQVCSRTFFGR